MLGFIDELELADNVYRTQDYIVTQDLSVTENDFDGMLISADKLGNMNMAYVGTKMGLPKYVFQNFLTEDKDDAFWVQYGIDLAEQGR